jgi:Sulfatase
MTKKMPEYPLFFLFVPVFFVLHGFVENCYFIRFADCWPLLGIYTGAAVVVYLLGRLLLKDATKAALFSAYIMGFYLFFGALHDFLRIHSIFLHKYSILLPFFVLLTILLILYLKKAASFHRTVLFLNALLVIYILVDCGTLVWKLNFSHARYAENQTLAQIPVVSCNDCAKPDIYFILFDCYNGSETLKNIYHYDNSSFDRYLEGQGFHIQKKSRSNYHDTPLSMASMLNLSYLSNMDTSHFLESDDYTGLTGVIAKNRVAGFLYSQGYSIVNYSVFDLPGHPSVAGQTFFPVKTRLITNRTLPNYIERDLREWVEDHFEDSTLLSGKRIMDFDRNNRLFLSLTKEESQKKSDKPRFIYTHIIMPHFPYFYDSLLHRRPLRDIAAHEYEDPAYYLQYLPYTNACAEDLISTIKRNTDGKAVIIFMSDHGLRYMPDKGVWPAAMFYNQNAVYFPDRDYRLFYDSISAVNQFRVVFNKMFRQNLPLLKDSVAFW